MSSIALTDEQREGVDLCVWLSKNRKKFGIITGAAGCHRKGQQILMFDGTVRSVENVVVGDTLMGPDSTPRTVLKLHSLVDTMVRVVPTKGESWVVNIDHILTLDISRTRRGAPTPLIDISVRDFLKKSSAFQKQCLLVRTGVDFVRKDQEIPPYILGMWLGDGTSSKCELTSMDPQLVAEWRAWGASNGVGCTTQHQKDNLSSVYRLSTGKAKGQSFPDKESYHARNVCLELFRKLNLLNNKHIPHQYLTGDRQQRLELLAGLIDTDGSLRNGGFDYISKLQLLSEQVAFLARSLGLAAYLSECKKSDQNGKIGTYYRVSISGDCELVPVKLDRKRPAKRRQKKRVLCTGFQIEPLDQPERYYGFSLDMDRRYLLGDFTITHNTGKTSLMEYVQQELKDVLFMSPTGKAAARLTEKTGTRAMTLHKWLKKASEGPDGEVIFTDKDLEEVEVPASGLICVDEASMVGSDMWSDIFNACVALGLSVVLVGDEGQLPPVTKFDEEAFSVFSKAFYKQWKPAFYHRLSKIHRQALESPIIRAATAVREGDYTKMLSELKVLSAQEALATLPKFDMVLAHSNKTRHGLNAWSRRLQGFRGSIQTGEPLLVLRNNYQLDVFNGETHVASEIEKLVECDVYDRYSKTEHKGIQFYSTAVAGRPCIISAAGLDGRDEIGTSALAGSVSYFKKNHGPYLHCNYGYTLSVHKAQGSEASRVLVFIEPTVRLMDVEGRKFVYTALTRAKDECVISMLDWNMTKAIQDRTLEM